MNLLGAGDPDPVRVVNPQGGSRIVLVGDHAGVAVPAALNRLGLPDEALGRHIAVDLGIAALGEALAAKLDAPFVHQVYSRLVIDCNRDPERADAMPEVSDGTSIPGNRALSPADRAARVAAIHEPYQQAIATALERFPLGLDRPHPSGASRLLPSPIGRGKGPAAAGGGKGEGDPTHARAALAEREPAVLVSLHSFTPRMNALDRPWQVGVLHDCGDTRFSHTLLAALRADPALTVGDNEPYRMADTDHTVPRHAYPDRPYAEIEVRQDLLATSSGVDAWSERLASALLQVMRELDLGTRE